MAIPLISVIIPCFNYGRFIAETLENVISQTLNSWECLIVDDGSTDNTKVIADFFCASDPRFKYIYQENQGLSSARNAGIRRATGSFVQLLDSDDLISPGKLELQTAFMLSNPDIDISYTDARYFSHDRPDMLFKSFRFADGSIEFTNNGWIKKLDGKGDDIVRTLLFDNIAPVNSMLIRRSSLLKIGDFDRDYHSLEDWEFWWRAAILNLRFTYFDHNEAYSLVRVHSTSMTSNTEKMYHYQAKFYIEALNFLLTNQSERVRNIGLAASRDIDLRLRRIIKELGISNFNKLKPLMDQLGFRRFIKLYLKELNASRRTKTKLLEN